MYPRFRLIALGSALALAATASLAAPYDEVSNPQALKYSNVEMTIPEYDVPFKRDGTVEDASFFRQVAPGVPAEQVRTLLGQPLDEGGGASGTEWNYNFTLRLPESSNYMVCQYKVVFDDANTVAETVWRRRQCLDIVEAS